MLSEDARLFELVDEAFEAPLDRRASIMWLTADLKDLRDLAAMQLAKAGELVVRYGLPLPER